jgi:integrase/recombinase XerD
MNDIKSRLKDDIDKFLVDLELEKGSSKNTVTSYEGDLLSLVDFVIKQNFENCEDISLEILRFWLSFLDKSGCSSVPVARQLSALRSFSKFAKSQKIANLNISKKLKRPKCTRKLPDTLIPNEIAKILELNVGNNQLAVRDSAMFKLMYSSGLRVSELCDVNIQSVDLENFFIGVDDNGAKEKIIPFGSIAKSKLEMYLTISRP